jgi:anti-anti-sigma factor
MKIEATREGGSAVLRLDGRLDREWAEQLSNVLEDLLGDGVRRLAIDLSMLTYISSAATQVLSRWQQELAVLRGEMELTSVSPAVREMLATMGWSLPVDAVEGAASGALDFRQSSWQTGPNLASSGNYQTSSSVPNGSLSARLHGNPARLSQAPFGPPDCETVNFPSQGFGLGVGAIGRDYEDCHERFGEIIGVAGCLAHFPSNGTRMADYLVGDGSVPPTGVLATGITCQGEFSRLVRFSSQPNAEAVPLSELAAVCLEASASSVAGLVIAGETAGLSGARLRKSPAGEGTPLQFEVPAVREWLTFAPERTYPVTTALIAGVVARSPKGPLAGHLRPIGRLGKLYGHFHAAVFSYRPLPQRTVELGTLLRRLFKEHELRDVLHLVWDDRGEDGVGESALLRGVGWVAPITRVS